jgi:hypothetical protein
MLLRFIVQSNLSTRCPDISGLVSGCFRFSRPDDPVYASSIRVLVGKFSSGLFACIPDFKVGCCLGSLNDLFYNRERLIQVMDNVVDGATVAYALKALSGSLSFE